MHLYALQMLIVHAIDFSLADKYSRQAHLLLNFAMLCDNEPHASHMPHEKDKKWYDNPY